MDGMTIEMPQTREIASSFISKMIQKNTDVDVKIDLGSFKVSILNEAKVHIELDASMSTKDIFKLMKLMMLS